MADEQTPQSDLIDDAIRQAERQLEAKLEALRMSALGEPTPPTAAPADDVAVLRPTGGAAPRASEPAQPAPAPTHGSEAAWTSPEPVDVPDEFPASWQERGGDDLTFAPADSSVSLGGNELYVPETEHPLDTEPEASDHADVDDAPEVPPTTFGHLAASVTDLTPVWDDEDEPSIAPPRPTTTRSFEAPTVDERPEPVHASWTAPGERTPRRDATPAQRVTSLPSEDEMQFWAHTRTALRNLQQVTDGMATQLTGNISSEVARIVHDEVAPTDQAVRTVQQQLQQGLPRMAEHLEAVIEQSMTAPTNALRQVRDEIPTQLERVAREQHATLRGELDRQSTNLHSAIQGDVAQLEQSVASNVTRMAQGATEAVGRVERDVDVLGETVVRFERGVHSEFDRVEAQLRSAIERVEVSLREELVEPTETVKKLDEELPARFGRVERTLVDQLQASQREIGGVLTSLVDANRASLDRIASMASTMDEDRARRAEDVEVVVDTVTTGWEGLAGAMKALFEQAEENSRRIAGIEQRLTQIRDLEGAVEGTLEEFRRHMKDLKPSPIVVTVSHDEAEVRNTSRGGWTPESR
ncbi:MAG: hypothetical protein JWL76_132 [Thermoleophilia bacterium]|nr:hypothetical protein [Thermoleophilia bacterium]